MCLALYTFTNQALPESSWSHDDPGIYIESATKENDRGALQWPHTEKYTYYVGSSQGCGCGWSAVSAWDDPDNAEKLMDRKKFVHLLQTTDLQSVWLVACWEGDQGAELLDPMTISLTDIATGEFEFEELRKYVVRNTP